MNDEVMDELGPIDYLIVEFPAGKADFSGAMAEKLKGLVEAGIVRVLDLLIITKDEGGEVDAFELHEFEGGGVGALRELGAEFAQLSLRRTSPTSPRRSSPAPWPRRSWENTWAAPFAASIRKSGGQLVGSGRIPVQAILAAAEASADAAPRRRSLRCP